MKKIYKIKKDHPVLDTIREEILKSHTYKKNTIGMCMPTIDDKPIVTNDIYGLKFNSNNWHVLTLNVGIFVDPKSDNPPKFITSDINGYDHYTYSSNVSIKLKNFLERNPLFNDIDEWAIPVVHPKGEFRYNGHNSDYRRFNASLRDSESTISYDITFPENVPNDRGILEWSKPACEALTKSYWREVALDETFNIKKGRTVWVDGVWFKYDYKNGLVEVYDAIIHSSIWSAIKLFDPKKETLDKIKSEIESGDLVVNEIKFINKKYEPREFKYEDLVAQWK